MQEKLEDVIRRGCEQSFTKEADFEHKVVMRLLESLGWDTINDIKIRPSLQAGTGRAEPDFIVGGEDGGFIVEAKIGDPLDDYFGQVESYLRLSDCKYAILYNGRSMAIFKMGIKGGPVYEWNCGQSTEIFGGLGKGGYPEALDSLIEGGMKRKSIQTFLSGNMESLRNIVVGHVSDNTGIPGDVVNRLIEVEVNLAALKAQPSPRNQDDGPVIVCPGRMDGKCGGFDFIQKTRGWGYIRLSEVKQPKYFALYEVENRQISKLYRIVKVHRGDITVANKFTGCKETMLENED